MEYQEYENALDAGFTFQCNECNQEITKEDGWVWMNGNLYCSDCEE
ncbi:LIM domain-containing protein [Paenibacillus sabinae]